MLSTAENEMAGFREGHLAQTSHSAWGRLLQEVLVEDERAGAWALPVSLLSYTCRSSSLWVLVSNSLSQRPTLATHLCFPMPFP